MKHCKPSWCSARESCVLVLLRLRQLIACSSVGLSPMLRFCNVAMKPNSQKNDVRWEYTRGALKPLLLQIPIDVQAKES